ncbi:carboxylating nicotinate-nucleotide diphosphorylase [Humibacter albus]|uniref:carboxylating nicotinate-nucleotide diphosphorylase n=1 Tax=Humibacter albus TaxID=427754 RepID=UPI0003B7B19A|nr:carboxylating nicotinate-nucleotide diphosphorylase [Humibacter albus]
MLTRQIIDRVVRNALDEDAPWGDVTSELFIPAEATASARLIAREPGVFSGGEVLQRVMHAVDERIRVSSLLGDGKPFEAGQTIAQVEGPARGILRGERVALNLVQRMSGIATLTAQYVALTTGTRARIVDTRKTTPGLRALERHAVVCGGGRNHRHSLSDAVMAKDNHLAVLTARGLSVTEAIRHVRSRLGHTTHVEVEVDRMDQIEPVLAGGVDTIMLDNFTVEQLRDGVALVAGRAIVEASGNVNLDTVAGIAATGVDVISVGALTHSVRSLDIGLDVEIAPALPEELGAENLGPEDLGADR